ncbi:hypothetical protein [Actinoplanes sp. NBRC 101535]|uniref:hypothetical protein n=1 Tax=Actinoplanes sp. NBRC 101535 TaxID=3032196 RepID=UPI0024A09402|nr:hypothetical protein [Actinoplanes sp. NBRC 101535]GLY08303.1 hypothetical protein Acsp01_86820 [Actinoplanes sp. NBRC 101535]
MSKRPPRVITIAEIERYFPLADASYWFGDRWCPAVHERKDGGYAIRVRTMQRHSGSSSTLNFDYFELDADGVITTAPRGFARDFKPGQVTDIKTQVERFATPDPNARRIA